MRIGAIKICWHHDHDDSLDSHGDLDVDGDASFDDDSS